MERTIALPQPPTTRRAAFRPAVRAGLAAAAAPALLGLLLWAAFLADVSRPPRAGAALAGAGAGRPRVAALTASQGLR